MAGWDNHRDYGGPEPNRLSVALIVVLVLVVTLALIVWTRSAGAQPLREIVGIASVIDGDTIEVHDERIRLSGFDAPERGRRCAGGANAYQSASLALSDFIGRRTVHCALSGTDNYGRHVGTCRVDGVDLGEHMVSQGWARDWPRYSHRAYADDEAQARAAHRGLWAMNCPSLWGDRNYD